MGQFDGTEANLRLGLSQADAPDPKVVAQQVAHLAHEVFGNQLSPDPATLHQEILSIFLRPPAMEQIEHFAREVSLLGYPNLLGAYLPPKPRVRTRGTVDLPMRTHEDALTFEWLSEDQPSKSYYLYRFEMIFGELI